MCRSNLAIFSSCIVSETEYFYEQWGIDLDPNYFYFYSSYYINTIIHNSPSDCTHHNKIPSYK